MTKPYSESCEQNKAIILQTITPYLRRVSQVLEIGSGTGQHAVFMAEKFPQLRWQTSDVADYLTGIQCWLDDAALENLPKVLELDVNRSWPTGNYDLIYSANTFHIMNVESVSNCIAGAAKCIQPGGFFIVYGPFNYNKSYTSASNQRFDEWLKMRDSESGIKDFEWINELANDAAMKLLDDIAMPANNRIIIWQRETL